MKGIVPSTYNGLDSGMNLHRWDNLPLAQEYGFVDRIRSTAELASVAMFKTRAEVFYWV